MLAFPAVDPPNFLLETGTGMYMYDVRLLSTSVGTSVIRTSIGHICETNNQIGLLNNQWAPRGSSQKQDISFSPTCAAAKTLTLWFSSTWTLQSSWFTSQTAPEFVSSEFGAFCLALVAGFQNQGAAHLSRWANRTCPWDSDMGHHHRQPQQPNKQTTKIIKITKITKITTEQQTTNEQHTNTRKSTSPSGVGCDGRSKAQCTWDPIPQCSPPPNHQWPRGPKILLMKNISKPITTKTKQTWIVKTDHL